MFNSLADLATWYPLLPVDGDDGTALSICRCIKDLRVTIPVPVHKDLSSVDSIRCVLTSVSASYIMFRATLGESILDIDGGMECYLDARDVPGDAESFAIVDPSLQTASGLSLQVHPDCLSVELDRSAADTGPLVLYDADGNPVSELKFRDGYNVSVQFKDGTLTFTARAAAGRGTYAATDSLARDYARIMAGRIKSAIKGVRSINGLTGTVRFSTSSHIEASVVHESTEDGEDRLVLRLTPTVVRTNA